MSSSTFPALSLFSGSGFYTCFTQNDLSVFSQTSPSLFIPNSSCGYSHQASLGTQSGSHLLPIPHLAWFKPCILSHLGPYLFSCLVSWLSDLFLKDHPCCSFAFFQSADSSREPSLTSSSHLPIPVLHPCSWPAPGFPRLEE